MGQGIDRQLIYTAYFWGNRNEVLAMGLQFPDVLLWGIWTFSEEFGLSARFQRTFKNFYEL